MRFTWLPWKYIVRHAARSHGFIDPLALFSHLRRFAQPSEVSEPIELLRAGMVFHARGLMNTRAIQHNLDWIWPYWVHRQFDPLDGSFIPRAFSLTHVNLTHRNWTALGIPDCRALPIVDPRGLVTPFFDGWSIDGWILAEGSDEHLIPSKAASGSQRLMFDQEHLSVVTEIAERGMSLRIEAEVIDQGANQELAVCRVSFQALAALPGGQGGWLVIALRPYNPEGISLIHQLALTSDRRNWIINKKPCLSFDTPVERHVVSSYRMGDVYLSLPAGGERGAMECDVGLITAAALFQLQPSEQRTVVVEVNLVEDKESSPLFSADAPRKSWSDSLKGLCRLDLPDQQFQFLFEAALRTLILHSPGEVYPGPYTYKRFWFRDAAFILQAMLCVGMKERVMRAIRRFPIKQTQAGFFRSQAGEWDSNGEALWIMHRLCQLADLPPQPEWERSILKGGRWIKEKRLADDKSSLQAGLLPAGFSAEHLGLNDYYYWDDFWGVAGLRAAAFMLEALGQPKAARDFYQEAEALMEAIERSLERSSRIRRHPGIAASPHRRMDAGAVGSIVASYPLRLWPADDERILNTVNFLIDHCFVHGAFFQDMIHSGINAYLTLHLAQVLLRAADSRFFDLVRTIADLASPTGQWPEAIHPQTRGGCMGDGQHVWAAAEWIMMMRNLFVREEDNCLILASGIPRDWLDQPKAMQCGPTPTPYGEISVRIEPKPPGSRVVVSWQASWRHWAPMIEVRVAGLRPHLVVDPPSESRVEIILS
ncbi:MAG: hypothetical protein K6U11_04930 [bacterium]|nr:hypothetical protein [bacterium]